jgi:hypothetical protein
MEALLRELDAARQATQVAEKKVEELSSIAASAKAAADELARIMHGRLANVA